MNVKEVAKQARVSTTTVSRVLNNIGPVKSTTRSRVMKAIAELKYHPNLHARFLSSGRTPVIGVIVSNLANPFFLDIVQKIESEVRTSGHEVLIVNINYQIEKLVSGIRQMIGQRVSGLAVMVSEMDPAVTDLLTSYGAPTVMFDVDCARRNIDCIRVDYRKAMQRVVQYLNILGHRSVAFVGHDSTLCSTSVRGRTFEEMVSHCGPCVECRTVLGSDRLDGGRQAARELLATGLRPTAIVCVTDVMAVGVVRELRERGLNVPHDVSVIGFDNITLSEFCEPALTTVHIPRDEIGMIAASWMMEGQHSPRGRSIMIDPELIIRASTGHIESVRGALLRGMSHLAGVPGADLRGCAVPALREGVTTL
jgi:DNA-binding LacI/PurR family transcriptional regulator